MCRCGGISVALRYAPRRLRCPRCDGVHVESMPWVRGHQQMTHALMVTLATWARTLPWQQVARLFRCSWGTVATAVEEAVAYGPAHRDLEHLTHIGIDEISRKRGHVYVTNVYDLERKRLVIGTRVRTALVGVVQQADRRAPPRQRHLERLDRQGAIIDGAHRPADDNAGEQIEDRREIQFAVGTNDKLGRIAHPALVRRLGGELSIQPVRGHRLVVVTHGRAPVALPDAGFQVLFRHQANDTRPAHPFGLLQEILVNPQATISLLTRVKRRPHQDL